jgi:PAS domain S-box-containing protein
MSFSAAGGYPFVTALDESTAHVDYRVLHVDDDPQFADLVSIYLEREGDGMEVATETSAPAGLERLDERRFDCVVSDYDMPGMDGLEFLRAVRDDYGDLPFILFTGKGNEAIASDAISAGVTDYLQKDGGSEQYTVLANRIENVAERHHAERGVRHGFQAIETAREGIAFLDEEGRFLYVNQAYCDVYGYERTALVGEHWELLYPDGHVEQVYEQILPSVPERGRWTGESVHVCADGRRLLVDHALAYTDEGVLLCLVEDITERKETERALERERQRFELFVENVDEYAIFALDTEGYITSWNVGAERLKRYRPDEVLGEHVSIFYPEEQVKAGYPDELLDTARRMGTVTDTGWRVRSDGSEFWADVTVTAVFDEDGQHRGYLKVTEDRTGERGTQPTLERDETFLERALDVLDDVFYVLDGTGDIVRVTERAATVTGYSRGELVSMSPADLLADDDGARVRTAVEEALETGETTLEAPLVTNDGGTIPYEFRMQRFDDADGTPFVAGVGRDISDRRRREQWLERQLEQFDHFGSVLSHDFRTPLQIARGRLELARDTGDAEHLDAAVDSLDRLDELVGELADVMREGELVCSVEATDLAGPLRSVWTALNTGDATLVVDGTCRIRADRDALKRFAENLFVNALEHGGDDVTVTVGTFDGGFYVEDDGPGLPEDERSRAFEAGYSTKSNGSGFGLASAKQLAVAHGWDIAATDGTAGGARFEITDVTFADE